MELLIGDKRRVVNFKWVGDSSNTIYVSTRHTEDHTLFEMLEFRVGTCDHFQVSKSPAKSDLEPVRRLKVPYRVEDFCFRPNNSAFIFGLNGIRPFELCLETGIEKRHFSLTSVFDHTSTTPPPPETALSQDEEEEIMNIVTCTNTQVMFALNEHSQMEIHGFQEDTQPINIKFNCPVRNIKINPHNSKNYLVLMKDYFVAFDMNNDMKHEIFNFGSHIFHDINWSPVDPDLFLVSGEFQTKEFITFSGFLKLHSFSSNRLPSYPK